MSYNFEERRKANQYLSENTNKMFGILKSKQLRIWGTKRLADKLAENIKAIDSLVKFKMLPMESEIFDRARAGPLTESFLAEVMATKLIFDNRVQEAYSQVSKIRSALT